MDTRKLATNYPYGTIVVNLLGAFIIGFIMAGILKSNTMMQPWIKFFAVTGVLGGLTTFSTFTYEGLALLQQGDWSGAIFYGGLQLIGGVLLCFLGMGLGNILFW